MYVRKLGVYLGLSISSLLLTANSAWAARTLEYSIQWSMEDNRYHVSMRPTETPEPDRSITAQVTIRVPHSSLNTEDFKVTSLSSAITGTIWRQSSRVDSPTEAREFSYISFTLSADQAGAFGWQANQEKEVFSFANSGSCLGPVALMADNDPFNVEHNSVGTNPGNQFTNLGWSDNNGENSYLGIYGDSADCRDSQDDDADGLMNGEEKQLGTDPLKADSDGDGLNDGAEVNTYHTDPLKADTDGDGLPDGAEIDTYNTDPLKLDSDGDGLTDGDEVINYKTNPLKADTDGDGLNDGAEVNTHQTNPLNTDTDNDGFSDGEEVNVLKTDPNVANAATLSIKVLLQGAYDYQTQLMKDSLRSKGLIPPTQPYNVAPLNYTGTEQVSAAQLALTGNDAIVDWVLVELRSASSKTTIVKRKAALLQRDGDVIDAASGSNKLAFNGLSAGSYYVSIRHRNHLGVMTANTVQLNATNVSVDFTANTTAVEGTHARLMTTDKSLLWVGDANMDNRLIANGAGQDSSIVLIKVLSAAENSAFNSNFIVPSYHVTDFNMDGQVVFTGPNNDTNLLISNVLSHPGNIGFNANYILRGQLPE